MIERSAIVAKQFHKFATFPRQQGEACIARDDFYLWAGRRIAVLRFVIVAFLMLSSAAMAESRIALVIGNSQYEHVQALANPSSDARLVAATLEPLGFEVTLLLDAGQDVMKSNIADFGRALRSGGADTVGLFYFAGHGVQSHGANFLLPTDAVIEDEADLDLVGVESDWVLRQMESARNRTNIVILDACRNNPFDASAKAGLAEMNAPTGSFLSFATAPGNVALDGTGSNSPFTEALSRNMQIAGQPIEQMFKQVRVDVLAATKGQQTPWDTSLLIDPFVFSQVQEPDPMEALLWSSVKNSNDPEQIKRFLDVYPEGEFAEIARELLFSELVEEPEQQPEPPQPEVASEEETALFGQAMAAMTIEGFEAYLQQYPDGVFVSPVMAELANLAEAAKVASAAPTPEPVAKDVEVPAEAAAITIGPASFRDPITEGEPHIVGKSLAELIEGSPLYPPIEGLPDEVWKGKQCNEVCHQWTKDDLCGQSTFYANNAESFISRKEHPYGDTFKLNLRLWAQAGCP